MKSLLSIIATLAALAGSGWAQSDYSSLLVPRQIQYQGRIATGSGGAWSGTEGYFAFALVQGSTILWNNWEGTSNPDDPGSAALGAGQVLTMPVANGVFSIRLGEGSDTNQQIPANVFFDPTSNAVRLGVKLAVWFSPSGSPPFTRLGPDVDFTSVPYAMVSGIAETVIERSITTGKLADGSVTATKLAELGISVPVGAVVAWWGTSANIPAGFELCDGGATTTQGATLFRNKPDLRGRFPRGAETARTNVVSPSFIGGADSIANRTTGGTALTAAQIPNHSHRMDFQTNNGANDGTHSHTFPIGRGDGDPRNMAADGEPNGQATKTVGTYSGGEHQHRVVGSTLTDGGGGGTGQNHDHTIPAHDNRPAYLEIFYIIRVK